MPTISELLVAAQSGEAQAQMSVGVAYLMGEITPRNGIEAAIWLSAAATQGNNTARLILAWMYEYGEGIPRNEAEAVRLYALAQDEVPEAANNLAVMYAQGRGCVKDLEKAEEALADSEGAKAVANESALSAGALPALSEGFGVEFLS